MTRVLLACALVTLCWDSVGALLETRSLRTGIKTQRLFQEAPDCDDARRELLARPGLNRTFIVSDCIKEVWLPWEPHTEPDGYSGGPGAGP